MEIEKTQKIAGTVGTAQKIVGAIILIAIVVCGSSYWVGSKIEQRFREGLDGASWQDITVSVVDYQRGVFGATARTEVVFQIPSQGTPSGIESVSVPVFHNIRHGPFSTLTAAARIHSEAQPTEEISAKLEEIFDDSLFPVLDTTVSWAGELHVHLVSSKLEATIKNITFKRDVSRAEGSQRDYTGKTSITFSKLYFQGESGAGAVRRIELENARTAIDTSIKDEVLIAGEVKFDVDKIIVGGETKETIDDFSLTFLLENIHTKNSWQAIGDTLGENQEQTAVAWLQRKPAFSIKEMRAHWPEGMVAVSFRIAYEGIDADPAPAPDTPLGGISSDLQMVVPRALVIRHMTSQVSEAIADTLEGGEENEVNVEAETREEVGKQMAAMLKEGVFVEKGDSLSVDAHLRNGVLNLNGEVKPVGILLELIPPFM